MQVELNGILYDVEIIKKNNKNTYVRVKDGKIVVTTNYFVSKNEIIKFIKNNQDSIIKMISKDNNKKEKKDNFYYFGNKYDVVYGFNDIEITNDKIFVKDKKTLDKYINNDIYNIFSNRLNYFYNLFEEKIPVPNLKIRKMTSRWGVCNIKNKNVTLNLELSKYNIEALDYVIVHELSHFVHHNHSKDFWLLVAKYYPKYKEVRKYLKDNG